VTGLVKGRIWSAPLFVQVMGLVLISLIAVPAIGGAMLFSLPPPLPEVYRLSEVAQALKSPGSHEVNEGPPLISRYRAEAPEESVRRTRWREDFRRTLADSLGVTPDRIIIKTDGPARVLMRVDRRGGPPPGSKDVGGPPRPPGAQPGSPPPDRRLDERVIFAPFKVAMRRDDGRWLVVAPKPVFRWDAWQTRFILVFVLAILLITPLAWLFARRVAAPIGGFAKAADRLGRDPRAPPLDLRGSAEVDAAATAFNQMQERLRRYVDDRTAMFGAIAHDLRTPLTRLKFRIEAAPAPLKAKLAADIDQMEAMLAATLGFVSDATRPRERTRLELASLVESIIDETAETGADAAIDRTDKLVIEGDPIALRRLVTNLVENAIKYGGRARGRVFAEDGCAIIEVDDDGPGVAEQDAERVFEPFYRGEPSRNRETGGLGLGLAVVRSVARAHGGEAVLTNRPGGGLTARVTLPL
jgi:two-component system OmpR family sensor kinase